MREREPLAIENLETRPDDFEHTLAILPHGGRWYVCIDEPSQWWRAYDSLELAAVGVASTLERLLVHEQGQKIKYARHPLANNGARSTFPAQDPRWRVRVTADCGEEQAEWHVEMLDDSAWLTSGYDLKECLQKCGRRLQSSPAAQFAAQQAKPVQALSIPTTAGPNVLTAIGEVTNVPPTKLVTVPPPLTRTVTTPGLIEDMMTDRVDVISAEIAGLEQRLREAKTDTEKRLVELRREQRALSAARSAYRDKIRAHEKPAK